MPNSPYDTYTSPLATRNASPEMLRLWSARHKFNTWRKIWLAVAEAQHEIGLSSSGGTGSSGTGVPPVGSPSHTKHTGGTPVPPRQELVTKEQVEELRAVVNRPGGITDEEIQAAEKYERELRHDVMAHVHALGDSCPKAKGIIHLGMTSQDVVCNADIMTLAQSLYLIGNKTLRCISDLANQAHAWRTLPTLAFTHYQPAQPVTLGRRLALWSHDLKLCFTRIKRYSPFNFYRPGGDEVSAYWDDRDFRGLDDTPFNGLPSRGVRGATGTQAAVLELAGGDTSRVDAFEWISMCNFWHGILTFEVDNVPTFTNGVALSEAQLTMEHGPTRLMGAVPAEFVLTGQTYPRVIDTFILADLASVASVLHKIATDIRLLCNRKELDEPFEDKQIGSSAMPYKRNPMRCERICGLSRFVMNLVGNAYDTAATQWLERTLDDSSNRRLSLPEAFLALDGALDLMHNVASGLVVYEATIRKNLMAELPFMATENIMMACVTLGGDRQEYHELIRVHAQAAGNRVKHEGLDNDLLDRLKADQHFWSKARGGPLSGELDWDGVLDPMKYVGRSVEQTERFIKEVVEPLREQYKDAIAKLGESGPKV